MAGPPRGVEGAEGTAGVTRGVEHFSAGGGTGLLVTGVWFRSTDVVRCTADVALDAGTTPAFTLCSGVLIDGAGIKHEVVAGLKSLKFRIQHINVWRKVNTFTIFPLLVF